MDPMVLLTMGLVFFGGVQVLVMLEAERRARRDREADEGTERRRLEHEEDVAYQTCYAEHFRLWSLGKRWAQTDLVDRAVVGLFRPEDVLPRDWGLMTQMLGRLSVEAGFLGAMALSLCHDTAASISLFNAAVRKAVRDSGSDDIAAQIKYVKAQHGDTLNEHLDAIRQNVREAAQLVLDAINHSESAKRKRGFDFRSDLESELGKKVALEVLERSKGLPPTQKV